MNMPGITKFYSHILVSGKTPQIRVLEMLVPRAIMLIDSIRILL